MKNTRVDLVPLTAEDRERFILDNQWAFKHGALVEFGERDDHIMIIVCGKGKNPFRSCKTAEQKPLSFCTTIIATEIDSFLF